MQKIVAVGDVGPKYNGSNMSNLSLTCLFHFRISKLRKFAFILTDLIRKGESIVLFLIIGLESNSHERGG